MVAEQLRTFLQFVADDRWYAAWFLLTTTGMRRGEVLGLRWSEVDLDYRRLSVVRSLTSVTSWATVWNRRLPRAGAEWRWTPPRSPFCATTVSAGERAPGKRCHLARHGSCLTTRTALPFTHIA